MTRGVGAAGFLGVAREVTSGTYVAPERYMLITSETLHHVQDTNWRRPLRGIASISGGVQGGSRIEGDITIEVTEGTLPYLLYGARGDVVKTGAGPNYIYTFTPNAKAEPVKTLSFCVVRNELAFGYTGCVISSMSFTVDNGELMCTLSIVGRDEAAQTKPTPTYELADPFGAGQYSIQVPTATQVFDTDTFTFAIDDNAEAQYRLETPSRAARFIKFGERTVDVSMERDFESRTEYDSYKSLTRQGITILATKGANNSVQLMTPAAIVDTYEITGLTGQAELIRAAVKYMGVYDPTTSKDYEIVVKCQENIT